jgi:hypothetical protein
MLDEMPSHLAQAYSRLPGRCLTPSWRRQHSIMTSVAVTGDNDFGRNHIGRIITRSAHEQSAPTHR